MVNRSLHLSYSGGRSDAIDATPLAIPHPCVYHDPPLRDLARVHAPTLLKTKHLHVASSLRPPDLFSSLTGPEGSTQTIETTVLPRPSAACKAREAFPLSALPVRLRPVQGVQGTYPRNFRYLPHQEADPEEGLPPPEGRAETMIPWLTAMLEWQPMHCHPTSNPSMEKVTFD